MKARRWVGRVVKRWRERRYVPRRGTSAAIRFGATITGAGLIGLYVDETLRWYAMVPIIVGIVALYYGVTAPKEVRKWTRR